MRFDHQLVAAYPLLRPVSFVIDNFSVYSMSDSVYGKSLHFFVYFHNPSLKENVCCKKGDLYSIVFG